MHTSDEELAVISEVYNFTWLR